MDIARLNLVPWKLDPELIDPVGRFPTVRMDQMRGYTDQRHHVEAIDHL